MPKKITGRVEVLVNGVLLLSKEGAKAGGVGLSGVPAFERTEVMGPSGIHGFVEAPVPATLEVTVSDRDDIRLDQFAQMEQNATIIFRTAGGSGKSYTMDAATCTGNFTITAGEGETELKFIGDFWTESVQ